MERESGGVNSVTKKKDSKNKPRKPANSFLLFHIENFAKIKASNPDMTDHGVRVKVGSIWRESLDPERKAEYERRSKVHWDKYLKEMAAYQGKDSKDKPRRDPIQ